MTSTAGDAGHEWAWPDALEGMKAAPQSHRVVFESRELRVLEVAVRPGEREPRHTHRHPAVLIVDQAAHIRYYGDDGQVTDVPEPAPGSLIGAEMMAPEAPHAVENVDDHDYHAFRVEFLDPRLEL